MRQVEEIERHDTKLRAELARQRRLGEEAPATDTQHRVQGPPPGE